VRLRKDAKPSLTLPALKEIAGPIFIIERRMLIRWCGISLSNKPEAQAKELCVNGKWAFEEPSLALLACKDMQ
jgi:hypothetical protein